LSNSTATILASSGRVFNACAVGLVALIVRADERILMLAHPKRPNKWEPPNGAFDGNETILDGLMREIREEAGEQIQVRPLGALHTYTFRYDDSIRYMVSIVYLFAYEGGEVIPGDDMAGSQVMWMSANEATNGAYDIIVPSEQPWLFKRAVDVYRLLKDAPPVIQQPEWTGKKNKYGE
jgi:ADP-ribose pyrophosphatase YjhB (NUDIX family)